jgi:hypothetical protein
MSMHYRSKKIILRSNEPVVYPKGLKTGKSLYTMKIQKDLTVILILEHNANRTDYALTLLRAIRLHQLEEAVESLDTEEVYSAFNFKDFWT